MFYKFEEGKDLIIDAVVERIKLQLNQEDADNCAEFIRQFYGTAAPDDLREWNIDDLYGAAVNLWSLLSERSPRQTKIKLYNPDFERHGWQTTHTVVEVVCDDMAFLVDSLRMALSRAGLATHLIMHMGGLHVVRNAAHHITHVFPRNSKVTEKGGLIEATVFIQIDRQTDQGVLDALHSTLEKVLHENRMVVDDWEKIRAKVKEAIGELDDVSAAIAPEEIQETRAFLHWIEDHHFTFLGLRDYDLVQKGKETIIQPVLGTGLGVLRDELAQPTARSISTMTPEARELTLSSHILVMSKTNTLATVHRDTYTDYIGIKRFNKQGQVIGERRIIGLYTSAAYNTNPKHIPFLRHKVASVMTKSALNIRGHAGRVLLNIIETLPRDDLIQASEDELLDISMGIFYLQERRRIRLFTRMDVYGRFVSCLVYVPKDLVNTELRAAMKEVLAASFNATDITVSTQFFDSTLARVHFMVRIDPKVPCVYDVKEIEAKLIEVGRSWADELQHHIAQTYSEEEANKLFNQYKNAFSRAYCDNFTARNAVYDIKHVQMLSEEHSLGLNFYRLVDEPANSFRLKVYHSDSTIPLSDVLPILEHLGLRAISERPYVLTFEEGKIVWINDFALQYIHEALFDLDKSKDLFQNAFTAVWFGNADNDGFNQLILAAGFDWRQVAVLRAYAKYFKQIGFTFSQDYMEKALNNNAEIARKLVRLFDIRFNPADISARESMFSDLVVSIFSDLDAVSNLDEDKIIRQYVQAISSSLRTNYYQTDAQQQVKSYLSIKLNSHTIPGVPRPHPMCEIFVYSPRFEAVHLRCGKVARGGLRWSDRREDFRTEVLGLMKAQQVKNAIIVPSGAKGGFVPKRQMFNATREEIMAEGIACYQQFIRGLLDITDNYKAGLVVKPAQVVCYDLDDPYLVVAADKGTATFSDIANAISYEYGFWLGDAFASGGSIGYDHKKMGITAKGAWESVKRHFYEMGVDISQTDFTVVGIGDLAGDVFGNGMLLSNHIKLLAAFNHLHIFIDPNPNPEASLAERTRMFNLPRSNWTDYDAKLISKGGGVFNRSAKSIPVSKEMAQVFGIEQAVIEPNELIRIILKAPVDLLWSAGIGTFVKAEAETNTDVGDRSNDATRVNAKDLQCKVIGEGGNLGLTQLARVEYALHGGLSYTDFIDNAGGVNCSDKEVNIKILLDTIVQAGDLTTKQRNDLLSEMTQEVSRLVLRDNFLQTLAISVAASQALRQAELHERYINHLVSTGKLDRSLEFLPDDKLMQDRRQMGIGLTRPGIAVLVCYSKILLKEAILASHVPEDAHLIPILVHAFPKPLQEKFAQQMQNHPLKREIIVTRLSNIINNEMGFTFVYRLQDETSAPVEAIVRAYMITRCAINLESIFNQIEDLGTSITAEQQSDMIQMYVRLSRRVTRWFLRMQPMHLDISEAADFYSKGVMELKSALPSILSTENRALYEEQYQARIDAGIPASLAHELTVTRGLFAAMDIIDISVQTQVSIVKVAQVYFGIDAFLDIDWIRTQIIIHPSDNHWESSAREALRDDLDWQQRQLTAGIIKLDGGEDKLMSCFEIWSKSHPGLIERWREILTDLRSSPSLNHTMFFVAIRGLLDMTQTTAQQPVTN